MSTMSGLVAILNPTLDEVVEVRDLGPTPVGVKPGRALPLVQNYPNLSPTQTYGEPTYQIEAARVVATYPVVNLSPADYSLSARQIRLGLIRNGVPLSTIQVAIDALPHPQRDEAQIYWEFSTEVHWDHPMTQALMAMVGIRKEQATAMWLLAKDYER